MKTRRRRAGRANPLRAVALVGVSLALLALSGCGRPRTVPPTMAKDLERLEQDLDNLAPYPEPALQSGSLWTEAGRGAALFRDTRAFRLNDLVTIVVQESSSGANASSTDLTRESDVNFRAPYVFGLDNLDRGLEADSVSDFRGDGSTVRSSRLAGTITARVVRVLANGDLVVAAQKTVMVNREQQVLTLVGSIRPIDLSPENRIPSSKIADLTVRLWGNGEVDDTVHQGWFTRIVNRVWPF